MCDLAGVPVESAAVRFYSVLLVLATNTFTRIIRQKACTETTKAEEEKR